MDTTVMQATGSGARGKARQRVVLASSERFALNQLDLPMIQSDSSFKSSLNQP